MPPALPATAEVVAVAGYVLLAAFFTAELLKGPPSPARRAFAAFNGVVAVNRLVYLASLVTPAAAAWWHVAEAGLLGTGALLLLFTYAYGGPAFPREGRVLVGLTVAAMAVFLAARLLALGSGEPRYLFEHVHFVYELPAARTLGAWPFRIPLLAVFGWAAVVLARKGWRPPASWPATTDDEIRARYTTGARVLAVIFLAGALAPVFRAAEYAGWIPLGAFSGILVVLLALSVIVFTTYASEPTSLQFRLTAVSLSVVVVVLTLTSGVLSEATVEAAREGRIALADQVQMLGEAGALDADRLPAGVAYAIVRGDGPDRLVTARTDLSLGVLDADARASRSGRALPSAATAPETGPDWAAVTDGAPVEWSRGALAPAERRFDAVAFRAGPTTYEVGVPHAVLRTRLGDVNRPILVLLVLVTVAIWIGAPLLFRGSLLTPVRRLRDGLARVEAGALDVRVPAPANDEIGDLGRSFNRMAEALGRAREHEAEAAQAEARAAQLRELDEAKSRFFANVSHEFRTPLTLTMGPLDDLLAGLYGPLDDAQTGQVELARRSADRVLGLINQILDVARLEAGRTRLRARPLDLGAFVGDLARRHAEQAERDGLTLNVDLPAAPVEVTADPAQLETALGNVLANAVKFTPAGGEIWVTVEADAPEADGGSARVAVRDTGPGIPAEDLPLVFDRFHQVRTTTFAQLGTGIGLALAKEIVGLHDGALTVESSTGTDGRPRGSTFTLALPLGQSHLAPDEVADGPAPRPASGAGDGRAGAPEAGVVAIASDPGVEVDDEDRTTVLVVEDHPDVRAYVRRHLEPAYRVVEAADGEAGLAAARERLPDLVVSDVMMPGLDGLGLVRALRADPATSFLPVVLLTAKAAPEDRLDGLAELADAYLTKPFDPAELRAQIDALLAVRRRLRERFRLEGVALAVGEGAVPEAAAPAIPSADEAFAAEVRETVDARLEDPAFGVEALAEALGQSRSTLHRRAKAMLGETPSNMIRAARLARGAALLAARAGTVGEIAYAVGFKSVGHFSDSFARQYGVRPSEYADRAGGDAAHEE